MTKIDLICIVVLIISASLLITQAVFNNDIGTIKQTNYLCTLYEKMGIFELDIPAREIGQYIDKGGINVQNCQKAKIIVMLFDYAWIVYVFGGLLLILLILYLVLGKRYEQDRRGSRHSSRYCQNCGKGLTCHEKYCSRCGKKIR
jgi:hypothetical protein